ncbi:MAG: translation initiation factor IF-2 [Candidatus Aminicenantes bacterium]|nr:translation initiation factor IF-2 [Candidatus Aminicenantes bacterium]
MKSQDKQKNPKIDTNKKKAAPQKMQIREGTTLKEFSEKLGIKGKNLIEKLKEKKFTVNLNDVITQRLMDPISKITQQSIEIISLEKEKQQKADKKDEVSSPPVVTIMGHVDHGKTTLLDAIRKSNLVGKESGGITQHIGAYKILYKDRPITFIDTPGHEAFTRLRARGAQVTDIVILIVAADDGVMPQTREAIHHAKSANVPIIVAINKIDKDNIDIDKVKQQLSKEGLLVEDWGGDVISVEISAKKNKNIDELLEMILLLSEVIELKGNPETQAQGVILEARLDSKKGPIATVIIRQGVLQRGDYFISGYCHGKARALFDEKGKPLKSAGLSTPVEVLGFCSVPSAGDLFQVVSHPEDARHIASLREEQSKKKEQPQRREHLSLDELFKKIEEGEVKELPLIIKADVQGSVEVLSDILPGLASKEVKINIVHAATGNITETDVLLASASNAIILGYNIKPNTKIIDIAREENVEIRYYNVIYNLTDDIKKALKGMLEPKIKEVYLGRAEVRRLFHIPKVGVIAGCYVTDGKIRRNAEIKIIRSGETVYRGKISSLKHVKENVNEVKKEYECGIGVDKFKDIQEGDIIEAYTLEKE